jgi:hypothetical protein
MQTLLVSGYSDLLVLRLLAELGVLGVLAIWIASLLAVRRERTGRVAESTFRTVSLERGNPHGAQR